MPTGGVDIPAATSTSSTATTEDSVADPPAQKKGWLGTPFRRGGSVQDLGQALNRLRAASLRHSDVEKLRQVGSSMLSRTVAVLHLKSLCLPA